MTVDEFWTIVDRVHAAAPRDMPAKCRLLEQELRQLPLEEVLAFDRHFSELYCAAYKWDLWGAAYIIHGGCSDDSFMDFRFTLISQGRRVYETGLVDADALAGFDIDREWVCYEGYQYVPLRVLEHHKYQPSEEEGEFKHPREPVGEPFDQEEMTPRFPRLVAKYGHEDTEPEVLRAKRDRSAKYQQMSERVEKLLLRAIIPTSGMVPPPRIVKQILAAGRAPHSSGLDFEWEPFVLDEGNFWSALATLQKLSPEKLNDARPDLAGKGIRLDVGCGDVTEYEQWIKSLVTRGLQ